MLAGCKHFKMLAGSLHFGCTMCKQCATCLQSANSRCKHQCLHLAECLQCAFLVPPMVLVRYYTVVQNEHPVMKVPYLRKRDPAERDSYGCFELETITGHAHVVPDFDCTTKGYTWTYANFDNIVVPQ